MNKDKKLEVLRSLFNDNRAEWPPEKFKNLFVKPTYLNKLESLRPCFLVGGRGTGKTTSLQSLKYDATLERLKSDGLDFGDQNYLGVLIRMNKNQTLAFQGQSLEPDIWSKAFAHYMNLLICLELTKLSLWLEDRSEDKLDTSAINRISLDLGLEDVKSLKDLQDSIRSGISRLQLFVNNPKNSSSQNINFSVSESPLKVFSQVLMEAGLLDEKVIFCCIDEYENLLEYQQAILNTYIKHAEPPLSYKVGVRVNGHKTKCTIEGQDPIKTPDDYADIHIADEGFEYFAKEVAELRLRYAVEKGVNVPVELNKFLKELSFEEEAIILGAEKVAKLVLEELEARDHSLHEIISKKPISEVYFLKYWQEKEKGDIVALAQDIIKNETVWNTRIGNHGYASLFWLSKGKKGLRIRKYYAGARTFLSLPAGNIRFFLELIDTAISHEVSQSKGILPNRLIISPKAQTLAVKDVGLRRLEQLESLAENGVKLKRLVLAIGKVFFELARTPSNTSPEVNSFIVEGRPQDVEKIEYLLAEGVGHLAFEIAPRTKATSNFEMRDSEYRLHRIYSGFFEISHRKKRRTKFDAKFLLNVLDEKPSKAISSLLEGHHQSDESELPEQLALFNAFYTNSEEM
tara:strand:+ start:320 stop:2206 length:1887 start_codon:yes stop_codon:yes gene_type:complete